MPMSDSLTSMAVYVTWQELHGESSTISDLRGKLGRLPLRQVIITCAIANALLRTWEGNIDLEHHEHLLRAFFPRRDASLLNSRARDDARQAFVFHRLQQLFLLKEAISFCKDGRTESAQFRQVFAECCLRASDLLHYDLAFNADHPRTVRLLPDMVTVNEYSSRESMLHKIARTRILLDEILDTATLRSRSEFIDIPKLFSSVSGMEVREYSNLVLAVLARYQRLSLADYIENPNQFLLNAANFERASVSPEVLKRFLCLNSAPLADLRQELNTKSIADFTAMRDRPLVDLGNGNYFPLDVGFLADKLESGVFWVVNNQALKTKAERGSHLTLWGHVFETYVSQLLKGVCEGTQNYFLANPVFQDGSEMCDGLIRCGSSGIFMEHKANMLNARAKYSGTPQEFLEDLKRKFVGTPENPKGVRQLANSIWKYGKKGGGQEARGVGKLLKIFPVLVAKDSALGSPMVNRFLNEEFRKLYDRKKVRPKVTPLFVLSIDELERISPYLSDKPLDEILHAKYINDPSQSWPFSAVPNEVLDKEPVRRNKMLEAKFADVINEACLDLFGKPFYGAADSEQPCSAAG